MCVQERDDWAVVVGADTIVVSDHWKLVGGREGRGRSERDDWSVVIIFSGGGWSHFGEARLCLFC